MLPNEKGSERPKTHVAVLSPICHAPVLLSMNTEPGCQKQGGVGFFMNHLGCRSLGKENLKCEDGLCARRLGFSDELSTPSAPLAVSSSKLGESPEKPMIVHNGWIWHHEKKVSEEGCIAMR